MSRGSFGRTVARAAASGGSRNYRARRPAAWYLLIFVIVVVGIGLIAYSRNERLHPVSASKNSKIGPTASDNWYVALGIDICGHVEPALPANTNLSKTGLRTVGDGLIDVSPGAVSDVSAFEGANATLGKFASEYPGLTLSATSIALPGDGQKTWSNGTRCTTGTVGAGELQAKVWSSPTASKGQIDTDAPAIHLDNGKMITLAFVPVGANIPEPTSKPALANALGSTTSTTSTTIAGTSSTSSTTAKNTSSTTSVPTTSTPKKKSS